MTTLREIHDEVERCNAETKRSLAALEFMNATLKADLAEMEKKERPWWNVEATVTVRLSLSVVRDRNWGADADGNRGVDRSWIEVERQEVEGNNPTLVAVVETALDGITDDLVWEAIGEEGEMRVRTEFNEALGTIDMRSA